MNSTEIDVDEIVYMLLQDKYLKAMLGKDDYTEQEVMLNSHELFPSDWSYVSNKLKKELITKAIQENRNLRAIYERETNLEKIPPKLDTK